MTQRSRDSLWMPRSGIAARVRLPPCARSWLLSTGSLTTRLRSLGARDFRVSVLLEAWRRPARLEAAALRMPLARVAWIREVLLLSGDNPWVFARTVIPVPSLAGSRRRLRRLGSRPLGNVFQQRCRVRRGPLEVARIAPTDSIYRRAEPHVVPGRWARRSMLYIQERPILVTEVFLPGLTANCSHGVEDVQ